MIFRGSSGFFRNCPHEPRTVYLRRLIFFEVTRFRVCILTAFARAGTSGSDKVKSRNKKILSPFRSHCRRVRFIQYSIELTLFVCRNHFISNTPPQKPPTWPVDGFVCSIRIARLVITPIFRRYLPQAAGKFDFIKICKSPTTETHCNTDCTFKIRQLRSRPSADCCNTPPIKHPFSSRS